MSVFDVNKSSGDDYSDVIREFNKLKEGDPLPREGLYMLLYDHFTYAGETISLRHKNGFVFFHFENDDVIQELLSGTPSVRIGTDMERRILSLLFKTGEILNIIQITLDVNNPESRELLDHLADKKKIEINLLNMVYGNIVKEKRLVIPIPKEILDAIKKAAG
jgi:hypothetical protein